MHKGSNADYRHVAFLARRSLPYWTRPCHSHCFSSAGNIAVGNNLITVFQVKSFVIMLIIKTQVQTYW